MLRALLFLIAAGTTSMQRVPTTKVETFPVSAQAGQSLLAEVDGEQSIQVFDSRDNQLKSKIESDTGGVWLNRLPAAGAYRVVVTSPTLKRYNLRLTLMDPNDPRLDPGVRPEQISVTDPKGKITWSREEFSPLAPDLGEYGPTAWRSKNGTLDITVMAVEGFKKTWWLKDEGPIAIAKLLSLPLDPHRLPGDFKAPADLTMFTQVRRIETPQLRAVRWLGAYDQMDLAPVSPLTYAVDGITRDGRFLISVRGRAAHPAAPNEPVEVAGPALAKARKQAADKLNAAAPSSFSPSLDQLDSIVRSITVAAEPKRP